MRENYFQISNATKSKLIVFWGRSTSVYISDVAIGNNAMRNEKQNYKKIVKCYNLILFAIKPRQLIFESSYSYQEYIYIHLN